MKNAKIKYFFSIKYLYLAMNRVFFIKFISYYYEYFTDLIDEKIEN
jgi:hypothetical protein